MKNSSNKNHQMTRMHSPSGTGISEPRLGRREALQWGGIWLLGSVGLTGCSGGSDVEPSLAPAPQLVKDMHSYANIDQVVMSHVYLNLTVDFARKVLSGYVELTLSARAAGVNTLVLDTKALNIQKVQRWDAGVLGDAAYQLGVVDDTFGQALTISIASNTTKVRVTYETTDSSDGLNWADPVQTFGKVKPLMYSLSQSIYGRTWFPQQDTPAIRVTYSADIHTPADMVVKMSASNSTDAIAATSHHFEMPQSIVPYLIAIAVGDFAFKPLGARSGVYAEPSISAKAAYEFADAEKMVQVVESLYGTYPWQRNDMMVMPPSFPFGGMEHAQLTFLTPTVITGDRELVSLNAHELSHAWSGNLVTNRYWRDLWLNEGFTSYVEKRVIEGVYGTQRADVERVLQYRNLQNDLSTLDAPAQILAIDLAGQHPDNVFTEIPYAKGSLFLTTLERLYGRTVFDAFVKSYFAKFAWTTITTEQFEDYLYAQLIDLYPGKMTHAKVKEWIYQSGYPADGYVPQANSLAAVDAQIAQLAAGQLTGDQLNTSDWTVNHWMYFLQVLPTSLPHTTLDALDAKYGLSTSTNLIKAFYWLRYALQANYQPAITKRLRSYLFEQGRIKLTKPLYQELIKTPAGITLAKSLFAETRSGLHSILVWEIETNVFKKANIT